MERIVIRVPNWEKFNPRSDVKKPTWFRLEYAVATSEALFDLTFEERWVFISLLSFIVEKVTHGSVECRVDWFAKHYGVSRDAVVSALAKLLDNGTISLLIARETRPKRVRNVRVPCAIGPGTLANADVPLRDETVRDETVRNVEEEQTAAPASLGVPEEKLSECLWGDPDIVEMLAEHNINVRGQKRWVRRAEIEAKLDSIWVEAELLNSFGRWPKSREEKPQYQGPGGFALFFNNWLTRAFEKIRQARECEDPTEAVEVPPIDTRAVGYGSAQPIPDEDMEWGEDDQGNTILKGIRKHCTDEVRT